MTNETSLCLSLVFLNNKTVTEGGRFGRIARKGYGNRLVGLGNAISDGYLVVYYPHLLVHPDYQGKGIGRMIVDRFQKKYGHFHQQILTADKKAIDFYRKCGFEKAGSTQSIRRLH